MAIMKKGSRSITVDGVPYRWNLRRRPTYGQALGSSFIVAVERADTIGSVLVVTLPQAHPANWVELPVVPVRPADTAHYIRLALQAGWNPSQRGIPFQLTIPESIDNG